VISCYNEEMNKDKIDNKDSACDECWASFNIVSKTITPEDVSNFLGVKPSRMSIKSEKTKKNGWFIESENNVKSKKFSDHLDYVLDIILPVNEKLQQFIRKHDLDVYMTCSWWGEMHCGPRLTPEQLRKLSELNIELQFYFASYED
jgi:hypothetical protein